MAYEKHVIRAAAVNVTDRIKVGGTMMSIKKFEYYSITNSVMFHLEDPNDPEGKTTLLTLYMQQPITVYTKK